MSVEPTPTLEPADQWVLDPVDRARLELHGGIRVADGVLVMLRDGRLFKVREP